MNIFTKLYNKSPIFLQNLAVTLYGLKLKNIRYGAEHDNYFKFLKLMDKATKEELLELQDNLLFELLSYAASNVDYYKNITKTLNLDISKEHVRAELNKFPILTKNQINDSPNNFLSSEFNTNKLIKNKTSGTSGSALTVYSTKTAIQRNYSFFSRLLWQHNLENNVTTATFVGRTIVPKAQTHPPYWRYNKSNNQILFSIYHLSESTINDYIQELETCSPTLIDSYPTPLFILAQYINTHNVNHNIRPSLIITSSEVLSDERRNAIETAFQCDVVDQYGSTEMAGFIAQCPHGKYHAAIEYGITEVLDSNGKPTKNGTGQLICTGFLNKAMPLIRYQTGDYVKLSPHPCSCGRNTPTFDSILGRTNDLFVTKDGNLVSNLGMIFKNLDPIVEAQLIQEDLDLININIVSKRILTTAEINQLCTDLKQRIGDITTININYYEKLERTAGGKLQTIISKVPHQLLGN